MLKGASCAAIDAVGEAGMAPDTCAYRHVLRTSSVRERMSTTPIQESDMQSYERRFWPRHRQDNINTKGAGRTQSFRLAFALCHASGAVVLTIRRKSVGCVMCCCRQNGKHV